MFLVMVPDNLQAGGPPIPLILALVCLAGLVPVEADPAGTVLVNNNPPWGSWPPPIPEVVETDEVSTYEAETESEPEPSTYSGMGSDVEQWRGLVTEYFAAGDVETALCLIGYESGGNPNAANPNSSAAGLFQFLKSTWDNMVPIEVTGGSYDSGAVFNPEANIRSAAWLQDAAGWSQWSPWNRGLCH